MKIILQKSRIFVKSNQNRNELNYIWTIMNQDKKPMTKEQLQSWLTETELRTGKSQLEIIREMQYLLEKRKQQKS